MDLSRASFVDFALLLGTDFSDRIPGVGPHRAIALIKKHGSIENIIENIKGHNPKGSREAYLHQVAQARQVFENLPPPPLPDAVKQGQIDNTAVTNYLSSLGLWRAAQLEWDSESAFNVDFFDSELEVEANQDLMGSNWFKDDPEVSTTKLA